MNVVVVNLPNLLTFSRIALTPLIGVAIVVGTSTAFAFWLFVIASLTDFADGYIAQKTNARSALGALLDPLADKILMVLVLFFLAGSGYIRKSLLWPCALMMGREIVVSGLRGSVGAHRLPVLPLARWKTFSQLVSVGALLFPPFSQAKIIHLLFLWGAAGISVWTGYLYVVRAISFRRAPLF